jgi:phosphoadenosine phosphosulfate reductase
MRAALAAHHRRCLLRQDRPGTEERHALVACGPGKQPAPFTRHVLPHAASDARGHVARTGGGGARVSALADLERLRRACAELDGPELLQVLVGPDGPLRHRTALVSSFGAESVVLLHMVAAVDPALPVIFLDTGRHFPETLAYRDRLVRRFDLKDVRSAYPDRLALLRHDRQGRLFADDPDLCCHIRKTEPLSEELEGFAAWITGRKRFQGGLRADLEAIEPEAGTGRLKLNPLATWDLERIEAYRVAHDLPEHPLVAKGYRSIGCASCTRPTKPGEPARAGRWFGIDKTECGIHLPAPHGDNI